MLSVNEVHKSDGGINFSMKYLEATNVPCNSGDTNVPCNSGDIIGEIISNSLSFVLKIKMLSVKRFKQIIPKKTILKVVESLRSLRNPNVVRFRGYSPQAYELCEVSFEEDGYRMP